MKLEYTKPEIEISLFATEAIICESGPGTTTTALSDNVIQNAPSDAFDFTKLN